MYNVGFGDCFLQSFEYDDPLDDGRSERHVLVDVGTTSRARTGPATERVAELIAQHSGGRLDVVVVSHRHRDHLSGFADDQTASIIEGLDPQLVIRPWTEDPKADERARGPGGVGEGSLGFLAALREGQRFAETLHRRFDAERGAGRARAGSLEHLAFDQVSNREAIQRLDALGERGEAEYLHAGAESRFGELVPGVELNVLGPPTVEQWEEVAGQRESDPEFWMLYGGLSADARRPDYWTRYRELLGGSAMNGGLAAAAEDGEDERDGAPASSGWDDEDMPTDDGDDLGGGPWRNPGTGQQRWVIERLRRQRSGSLLRIVRILDEALNNTSLNVLFKAGDRRLLFPGDAQIESWNYVLKHPEVAERNRRELARVDLYKVGHHGSRNATPRSLHALWAGRRAEGGRMTALLSTKGGVHGKTEATAVPRRTLVEALRGVADLHSTEDLARDVPFVEVVAPTTGAAGFERV